MPCERIPERETEACNVGEEPRSSDPDVFRIRHQQRNSDLLQVKHVCVPKFLWDVLRKRAE